MTKKWKFEKNQVENNSKTPKTLAKKNSRQLRGRGFPKKRKSEDPSGSTRDITAHLIHDQNTSITVSCTIFNFPSAGNDPGWIYWSYEFFLFRPWGLRTQRPAQTGPRGQNPAFQRFDPMILWSILWRFRWKTLESHNSKQMTVYKQIIFFYEKNDFFQNVFFDRKIFWNSSFFEFPYSLFIKNQKIC